MTRLSGRSSRRLRWAAPILAALTLAGCILIDGPDPDLARRDALALEKFIAVPGAPAIVAATTAEAADAASSLTRARLEELTARRGARAVRGSETPLFFGSRLGRAYLAAGDGVARAFAAGRPAASCPGRGAALGAETLAGAVEQALSACLASQEASEPFRDVLPEDFEQQDDAAGPECACRLIAAGPALLAPPDAFAYAGSVSAAAQNVAPDGTLGAFAPLIAEADPDAAAPGAARLLLRDVRGPVARLVLEASADGAAAAARLTQDGPAAADGEPAGGPVWTGAWRQEGVRRGRQAGVAALTGPDRARVVLFIGYEPEELLRRQEALIAEARALFEP